MIHIILVAVVIVEFVVLFKVSKDYFMTKELEDIIVESYPDMPTHDCTLGEEHGCPTCEAYTDYAEEIATSQRLENEKWSTYYQVQGN